MLKKLGNYTVNVLVEIELLFESHNGENSKVADVEKAGINITVYTFYTFIKSID